jgi:hypothetical protein
MRNHPQDIAPEQQDRPHRLREPKLAGPANERQDKRCEPQTERVRQETTHGVHP